MNKVYEIYKRLLSSLGHQAWWPAETPFEVIIGAILTQNTNWRNVEKAILNLKDSNLISPDSIANCPLATLSKNIKPAGYYNVKAKYLKEFSGRFLQDYGGSIKVLRDLDCMEIREWLLSLKGVGEETADSILLYALNKPVFVVDAYTRRIFLRHSLIDEAASYGNVQEIVEKDFPQDSKILGEFHALLVEVGKHFCKRKNPLCEKCPISDSIFYS